MRGLAFTQDVFQVNDSMTLMTGNHAFKSRLDVQVVADKRIAAPAALYTFPGPRQPTWQQSMAPTARAITSFTQYFGLPDLEYDTDQYGVFVQDDWRVTPDLKVLYGVRYDLYGVPEADPNAPVATRRATIP